MAFKELLIARNCQKFVNSIFWAIDANKILI